MKSDHWKSINYSLIGKVLSELHFEEKLQFACLGETEKHYYLQGKKQRWEFQATQTIWGMLLIDTNTLRVSTGGHLLVTELLLDIQDLIEINDINLAGLLEEIQQTLYCDLQIASTNPLCSARELVTMDEVTRQRYLNAHPKAIANKGRLGWGNEALAAYSPESAKAIELHYVAIKKELCGIGYREKLTQKMLFTDVLGKQAYETMIERIPVESKDGFFIFAVHPWQFKRFICVQYAQYFAEGEAIDLGVAKGEWLAQQSIRTLSAIDPNIKYDVKTSLTILNTSCYRGIPGEFIKQGPILSAWLANITQQDPLLNRLGLHVQQEVAGVHCPHPQQQHIEGSYRYNEMLGCIWRESAQSILADNQRPLSMATLMQEDLVGDSAIVALIELSALDAESWLRKLFQHVVVPLYHLMCRYGVALVAHGQNITLVLENNQPVGCMIKDFHGDLRLIDQDFPELLSLDANVVKHLTRLPKEYLIHDLITGHFVTVLRFVSPKLTKIGISEIQFYAWLADEIKTYQQLNPSLQARFAMFDILQPKIDKICVNRVRFKIGYGDSEERPLPELGTPISNPLHCA